MTLPLLAACARDRSRLAASALTSLATLSGEAVHAHASIRSGYAHQLKHARYVAAQRLDGLSEVIGALRSARGRQRLPSRLDGAAEIVADIKSLLEQHLLAGDLFTASAQELRELASAYDGLASTDGSHAAAAR